MNNGITKPFLLLPRGEMNESFRNEGVDHFCKEVE